MAILVRSNGLELTCRQVGPVLYRLVPRSHRFPLPIVLGQIMEEDEARAMVKSLRATGEYSQENQETGNFT
jgi:hypothetical protein